jgi:TRAP-type transport system periplasmic protein
MRHGRQHLRGLASVAVVGLALTACGSDSAAPEASSGADGEITGPEVTLTLGHPFPASHLIQTGAMDPFIEEVAEVTNGTVTIEVVPAAGLGPAPATYENTVVGAQDLGWALHGYTPGRFPLTGIVEMPFMFESATEATEALWTLYEEFPALQEEYSDVHVLALFTHDAGQLWTSGEPVTSTEDMEGRTLRAPGPMQEALITELGGSPVGLPSPELFDALERGVVDGLMIAHSGLDSFNLYEVLDNGLECNCYVAAQFLVASQDAWARLSPEQQEAIDEIAGRELSLRAAEVYDAEFEAVNAKLEAQGIEVTPLEGEERERWHAAGDEVAQAWIDDREAEGAPAQDMYDRLQEIAG